MKSFYTIICGNIYQSDNNFIFEHFIYKRFETFEDAVQAVKLNIKQFANTTTKYNGNFQKELSNKYSIVKLQKVDTERMKIDGNYYEIIERFANDKSINDLINKVVLLNDG